MTRSTTPTTWRRWRTPASPWAWTASGIDHFATSRERSDLVAEMCRRGYADRMVLAHDTCCYIDWFGPGTLDDLKDWHYLHVSQDVLPYLREHGVPESDIDAMLVANPARILAG